MTTNVHPTDSECLDVLGVNGMLGVDECDRVALFLCLEHDKVMFDTKMMAVQ